jgi:hypothetical protein
MNRISILLQTFLRDEYLFEAVSGIEEALPECQIIIADDGDESLKKHVLYDRLASEGHVIILLPFDSGFGAKYNACVDRAERPYLYLGLDDFDFRHMRDYMQQLLAVLDTFSQVDIASGQLKERPWEYMLEDQGERVIEHPFVPPAIPRIAPFKGRELKWHLCDLTMYNSLIRKGVLGRNAVHWDEDVKIGGGEHGAFFVDLKRAGHLMAFVPSATFSEIHGLPTDPRYPDFRNRAQNKKFPCYAHRGIKEYVTGSGVVERPCGC